MAGFTVTTEGDGQLTENPSGIEVRSLPDAEHATLIRILEPK
jgi:hypothetical protein